jgi:hypothetical protein
MKNQYAKITIEYIDYLIDLSDAQAFLTIMSKASRLVMKHDKHKDEYVPMLDGRVTVMVSLPTSAEADAPVYDRSEMD